MGNCRRCGLSVVSRDGRSLRFANPKKPKAHLCPPGFYEDVLDEKSRPIRDAMQAWARQRGLGWSGGWVAQEKGWQYHLSGADLPFVIEVWVPESGKAAYVYGQKSASGGRWSVKANTVLGIKRGLTSLYEMKP